jgi:hypothetical protein
LNESNTYVVRTHIACRCSRPLPETK